MELKDLKPSCEKIQIVIGGGSAQGVMWVQRMMHLCAKHQMEQPVFLWQIDQLYKHARLAGGANYALAEAKSVARFVDRAAFGLLVKNRVREQDGWAYYWDIQAPLLLAQGQKWTRVVKTTGCHEFKIICQPEFDAPQADSTIKPDYRSYDLLPITCRKTATLKFDLEIDAVNEKSELTIMRKFGKSRRSRRWVELGRVSFNLWVPPGSRTLQIWECIEDIQARVAAAFSTHQQQAGVHGVNGDGLPSMAPVPQMQPGASPELSAEDVEMGGMEGAERIADCITVATGYGHTSQPDNGEGSNRGSRRRGRTVATGMFAR